MLRFSAILFVNSQNKPARNSGGNPGQKSLTFETGRGIMQQPPDDGNRTDQNRANLPAAVADWSPVANRLQNSLWNKKTRLYAGFLLGQSP
jgi:hypothetical protein